MKYSKLGTSTLEISELCLGTMTWGEQNTEAEAHAQLDYALSAGINFIDTAELYPVPPKGDTQGLTEKYIGSWLKKRAQRDDIVLASKFCASADWIPYLRDGKVKADAGNISKALDASLTRLQTDYIDLYQIHWPERDTNYFGKLGYYHAPEKDGVPIEETMAALADECRKGRIRYIGISNETAWGIAEYLRLAEAKQLPRIVSIQNPYNLLNRTFEIGMAEFVHRAQVSLMAYSPLAFGALTGKYVGGAKPAQARMSLFSHFSRYLNELGTKATSNYVALAKEHGLTPTKMALAFINSRSFVTSNIIGATTLKQLQENISSLDVTLSNTVLKGIEEIYQRYPNPCP